MSSRTFTLLLSLVALCYSATLSFTGEVQFNKVYTHVVGPWNVHDTAMLQLSNFKISVHYCLVDAAYKLPNGTHFNENNCAFYGNASSHPNVALALRDTTYTLGIYFAVAVKAGDATNVTVDFSYDNCAADTFWDGTSCVAKTGDVTGVNGTLDVDLKPKETQYFIWSNAYRAGGKTYGALHWSLVNSDRGFIDAGNVEVWMRWMGVPSKGNHDGQDGLNGTLVLEAPSVGMWVIAIHSLAEANDVAHFQWSLDDCTFPNAGKGCQTKVAVAETNMTLTALPGQWQYWRFVATKNISLLVSVTTGDGTDVPVLYASRGQIPYNPSITDITNCNRDYCDVVNSILYNVTGDQEEEWYIGVTAAPTVKTGSNTTFGIWWNDSCVTNCEFENHGECDASGRCECEIDFKGISCAVSQGLGPQYIVLIIIASLVVASAIIGFVAWAYMRRKRANYEIVS